MGMKGSRKSLTTVTRAPPMVAERSNTRSPAIADPPMPQMTTWSVMGGKFGRLAAQTCCQASAHWRGPSHSRSRILVGSNAAYVRGSSQAVHVRSRVERFLSGSAKVEKGLAEERHEVQVFVPSPFAEVVPLLYVFRRQQETSAHGVFETYAGVVQDCHVDRIVNQAIQDDIQADPILQDGFPVARLQGLPTPRYQCPGILSHGH